MPYPKKELSKSSPHLVLTTNESITEFADSGPSNTPPRGRAPPKPPARYVADGTGAAGALTRPSTTTTPIAVLSPLKSGAPPTWSRGPGPSRSGDIAGPVLDPAISPVTEIETIGSGRFTTPAPAPTARTSICDRAY
ncbi:hypothetical protein EVAR_62475_1 [Eumeta japonica]|uniref:Uncharacterized protein n=1 Tax=Eumeta variegata TaxID=151549 RepID=A0A4C1ZJN8_EUMVA|nr:hypothetical protein EVAR_62475_1 [Eumeta japonica]